MFEEKVSDPPVLDAGNPGWDAFVGPTEIMTDDRYPPMLLPTIFAAHAFAHALELNGRIIRAMAGLPRSR